MPTSPLHNNGVRHNKGVLRVLCGLPFSGKSTIALINTNAMAVVAPDAIRVAMHGQLFNPRAEPLVWATATIMVRALFAAGHRTVLVDATNVTNEHRRKWLCEDWDTQFLHVPTPKEVCIERAVEAGRDDMVPVIERMATQWQEFDVEMNVLVMNTDD